MKRKRRGFTAF